MSCLKRRGLDLSVVVAVTGTVLILGCGRERPGGDSGREDMTEGAPRQATGKAPPLPQAGPLASPRSLHQVGLPTELTRKAIPRDNPQTPEKIALGLKLFFDGRLSADGCATCHAPARAFTDDRPVSISIVGRAGQRNAPTVLNALYNKAQFWDGRAKTLEEQATLPIVNPSEMGQPTLDAPLAIVIGKKIEMAISV